jgi:prolyl oligopeptidase PreP (S9A serine peptidase family)
MGGLFYENTDGSHTAAPNNAQAAFDKAVAFEFVLQTLFQ